MSINVNVEEKTIPQEIAAYNSRWGWHYLPHSSYLQLKELNKWAFEAYKKHYEFYKWSLHSSNFYRKL